MKRITAQVKQVFSLPRRLMLFQLIVPNRFWFSGVLALSRVQAAVARMAGRPKCARYEALLVDRWLWELTLRGCFPIKYRVNGAQHLRMPNPGEVGTLYCSFHLPLSSVILRGLLESGVTLQFVIIASHIMNMDGNMDGKGGWIPTGLDEAIKALPPGPATLLRARTVLRNGGSLATMLDRNFDQPLQPQMMRLAARVRARVVLCWVEMDATDILTVTYMTAPHPVPDTDEKVLANLAVLEDQRERIIGRLRGRRWGRQNADDEEPTQGNASIA
jgi:hypothetical protein